MIIDNTSKSLSINESASVVSGTKPRYILEGIFTQFNQVNRNNRIYTSQSFLPHLDELISRKNSLGVVYGEFDHPDVFDISMKSLSHTVESAVYNKETDSVHGSIRLLNTYYGKEAQSIIDDQLPLFVSSRAAGVTEGNGHVSLRKLFTYDIVADPGFASARMNLKSMNESLGFGDNTDTMIIDWSEKSVNKLFETNGNEQITKAMMLEFQDYMKNMVANLETKIKEAITNNEDPEKIAKLAARHESAEYTTDQISSYLEFVKENFSIIVNKQEKIDKALEQLDQYVSLNTKVETLEKQLENATRFIEYVARKTKNTIAFAENIAEEASNEIEAIKESVNENKVYFDKISEALDSKFDKSIKFTEHTAKQLKSVEERVSITELFSEYVAENTKDAKDNLADNIAFTDLLSGHTEDNITYMKYLEKVADTLTKHSDKLTETVNSLITDRLVENTEGVKEPVVLQTATEALNEFNKTWDTTIVNNEDDTVIVSEDIVNGVQTDDTAQPVDGNDGAEQPGAQGEETPAQEGEEGALPAQEGEEQPAQEETPAEEVQPAQGEEGTQSDTPAQDADADNTNVEVQEVTPDGTNVVPGDDLPVVNVEPEATAEIQPESDLTSQLDAEVNANDDTVSVENTPGETTITFGDEKVVKIVGTEDTGTIVTTDGDGNVTIKLSGTDDTIVKHESEVEPIAFENKDVNILETIKSFITEAKKRKVAEKEVPTFFNFMNETQIDLFKGLPFEKQEAVKLYMEDKEYFTTDDVTKLLYQAIESKPKTLQEKILDNMPEDVKPLWENLNEGVKQTVLASSAWFPIKNELSIEHFWRTRNLEKYSTPLNESVKEVVTDIVFPEDVKFTDSQIDKFMDRFNNI